MTISNWEYTGNPCKLTPPVTIHLITHCNTKLAPYTFYINRLLSIPTMEQEKQHEWNTIYTMAKNNGFPLRLIYILKHKINKAQLTSHKPTSATQKKWITFTYHRSHIYKVTNLFGNTNLQIAFRTNNTILHHLRH